MCVELDICLTLGRKRIMEKSRTYKCLKCDVELGIEDIISMTHEEEHDDVNLLCGSCDRIVIARRYKTMSWSIENDSKEKKL